jgi:hypothetical protein
MDVLKDCARGGSSGVPRSPFGQMHCAISVQKRSWSLKFAPKAFAGTAPSPRYCQFSTKIRTTPQSSRSISMATEKQKAANRANAQKSTGPKTAAGRLKSSRNAYRHGLSLPLHLDMSTSAKADAARIGARPGGRGGTGGGSRSGAGTARTFANPRRPRGADVRGRPTSTISSRWRRSTATSASPLPSGDGHLVSSRFQGPKG